MTMLDLELIKLDKSHYFMLNNNNVSNTKINYNNRVFFDKFHRVDSTLTMAIVKKHLANQIVVAHNIITNNKVENIVIDYNGRNDSVFYHKAQLLLRNEGYLNFTAYRSKTQGHLHIYIHKGHTNLLEANVLAKTLSLKLEKVAPKQWRVFPTDEVPPKFNILVLPYEVYAKERGSFWSKHL
ncbi:DUF1882 domain-containing protein [Helicobacter sp. MIT 14-3879]|uniref:DUF1882 domain-containing protein n=1 Tax=Helicobacter sp. MIT 14-3879 TaxID=2040649 RepID=UPI000E1F275D|nr:DUF1882 domain-containing protein [Helicobacter sp. MIT 14-3879]RDU62287.1 DUF1882 domain-containing protein [Helicobacter sp. MIT 14-3879]